MILGDWITSKYCPLFLESKTSSFLSFLVYLCVQASVYNRWLEWHPPIPPPTSFYLLLFLWIPQGAVVRGLGWVSRLACGARLGHILSMWPLSKSHRLSGPCFFMFKVIDGVTNTLPHYFLRWLRTLNKVFVIWAMWKYFINSMSARIIVLKASWRKEVCWCGKKTRQSFKNLIVSKGITMG